jgi:beta-1,4-galactosyltransferase 4
MWLLVLLIILFIMLNSYKSRETFVNKSNKLIVIIPIRDREDDLERYLKNMIPIFEHQKINYKIFVIEQSPNKKFNKGKINNIGFLEALKQNPTADRFLFNDVDNFPLDKDTINYNTYIKGFHHFFGNPKWLGGFFMTDAKNFKKVNGYSNKFWGWGGEDGDLQNRIKIHNIEIIRDVFYHRHKNNKIYDKSNTRDINNNYYKTRNMLNRKYINEPKTIQEDGLKQNQYKILKKYNMNQDSNIIRIVVNI